jgi:death on curing protein
VNEPTWVEKATILLAHAEALAEHGGLEGLRDEGLLESALARPKNMFAYESGASLYQLAASYAFGIARNHPFMDGNKRTAFIAAALFVALNGLRLNADQVDATRTFLALAAGKLTEEELANWLEAHTVLAKKPVVNE